MHRVHYLPRYILCFFKNWLYTSTNKYQYYQHLQCVTSVENKKLPWYLQVKAPTCLYLLSGAVHFLCLHSKKKEILDKKIIKITTGHHRYLSSKQYFNHHKIHILLKKNIDIGRQPYAYSNPYSTIDQVNQQRQPHTATFRVNISQISCINIYSVVPGET